MALPTCGLYRTTRALEAIPAGRLVYFHNHGTPGPGVYLPASWSFNRASWQTHGTTLKELAWADSLVALPPEGLYAVREPFLCCARACVQFHGGQLVQLGYDGEATAILFVPEWTRSGLGFPEQGTRLDESRLPLLSQLRVSHAADAPVDGFVH
jgi:hypothetical protein